MANTKRKTTAKIARNNIKVVQLKKLNNYHVSDGDLELLHDSVNNNSILDFCLFFLSIAISILIGTLYSTPNTYHVSTGIVILICTLATIGIILLVSWVLGRKKSRLIINRIKKQKIIESDQYN
jgi:hypothetical protein